MIKTTGASASAFSTFNLNGDGSFFGLSDRNIPRSDLKPGHHSRHYVTRLVTFSIDGCLFRVPLNTLLEGKHFQEMFNDEKLGDDAQGQSDDNPIVLNPEAGVTAADMETFLDVLFSREVVGKISMQFKQWSAALRLASMWSFDNVRQFCIKNMDGVVPISNPFDVIALADKCGVDQWLKVAFKTLCERQASLSADEGTKLGYRRFAAVCRVREKRKDPGFTCGRCSACKPLFGGMPAKPAATAPPAISPFTFGKPSSTSSTAVWASSCTKDVTGLVEQEPDLLVVGL